MHSCSICAGATPRWRPPLRACSPASCSTSPLMRTCWMQQVCYTRVGVRVVGKLGGLWQHLCGRHASLGAVAALVRAGYLAQACS